MGISCRMILSLPYANQLRLLAGESGLGNEVQWVHYLEEPSYAQWLRGGELIILTGLVTGSDEKNLGRLVELLFEKQAAGVVVALSPYIPRVPEGICRLCDRLGLPLFQMPAQVRILDISQSICFAIFQRRRRADQAEALLQDLLTGTRLSEKRVQSLKQLGFDGTRKYRAAVFQVEVTNPPEPAAGPAGMVFYEEESREQYLYQVYALLREAVQAQADPCWLTVDGETILWLAEEPPKPLLEQLAAGLERRLPGVKARVGVSETLTDIRDLKGCARHARDALWLGSRKGTGGVVFCYDDLVIYQLFQRVESREELGQMAARVLGDLLLPENRDLLETLDCYVRCNGSAKKAAEPLFLHVNTLHYRLKKIEAILGRDLSQAEDLFDVMLALKLHWFQEQELGFK